MGIINFRLGFFIIVFIIIIYLPTYVFGACHVDNIILASNQLDSNNKFILNRVSMSPFECLNVVKINLELTKIYAKVEYKLSRYAPYNIKAMCNNFNWHCLAGSEEDVWTNNSSCYDQCDKNIRLSVTGTMPHFEGDKCAIKLGQMKYRVDTCYSIGNQHLVTIYEVSDIDYDIYLDFLVHVNDKTKSLSINTKDIYEFMGIKFSEFNSYSNKPAHFIATHDDAIFCSIYRLDVSKVCLF